MRFCHPSLSLILVIGFVIGGIAFKSMTPVGCAEFMPNDSVFVLTGDARRIPFAMEQLHKHPDINLYIIGTGATISNDIARHATIESQSKSTYQNALAIRNIAHRNNLDRLVIITTEDHMNRAHYLIRHEIPNVNIALCSVRLTNMPATKRLERWTVEYIKYIVTMIGIKES